MVDGTYEAADIAAELRRRLPAVGTKKLHKLLYFCQGHHLADTGQPLFGGSIAAWDMGPVVGGLWRHEKTHGPVVASRTLDQGALNTIGYVVSRYGRLTGRDLEILTHGETPWLAARERATGGGERSPKITRSDLIGYFGSQDAHDEDAVIEPSPEAIRDLLRGATDRSAVEARPDDLERLRYRLAALGRQGS